MVVGPLGMEVISRFAISAFILLLLAMEAPENLQVFHL
jgi:hypothetical protein